MATDKIIVEITEKLVAFIQENLLADDQDVRIDATTQLLELGVLDSLKTAILLNYITHELKITVPPARLSIRNFKDVQSIAAMLSDLTAIPSK